MPTLAPPVFVAQKPNRKETPVPLRAILTGLAIVVIVTLIVAIGLSDKDHGHFAGIEMLLVAFFFVLGIGITRNVGGVLVDEHNVMSVARFQLAMWTVLILGAYLSYALVRVARNLPDAANVGFDPHLLMLLGISATSLVGAPIAMSNKTDQTPDKTTLQKTADRTGESAEAVEDNAHGLIYSNPSAEDAQVTDMFQGDEIGNTLHIDMAKVQMFLFTVVIGAAFFGNVYHTLLDPNNKLADLPPLSDGTVWLLGISHAGFLSSKALPHTKTASDNA